MQEICSANLEAMSPHAGAVSSVVLSIFPSVANDPSLADAMQELLTTLARCPGGAVPAMAREGVPQLMQQLQSAALQDDAGGATMVEATLDMLSSFISPSDKGVPATCYANFSFGVRA